jgi:hypothetical protein
VFCKLKDAVVGIVEPTARNAGSKETGMRYNDDDLLRPVIEAFQGGLPTCKKRLLGKCIGGACWGCLVWIDWVQRCEVNRGELLGQKRRG